MNKFDKEIKNMASKENISIPSEAHEQIDKILDSLPEIEVRKRIKIFPKVAVGVASFLFVLLVFMPNASVAYAEAVKDIPVIGKIVQAFTIRNYQYSDENHEMNIEVPNISDPENSDAANRINKDVNKLTKELMMQFYDDLKEIGNNGHGSIHTEYEVITNTDNWFTLKLSVCLISGSGMNYYKYYHIDRKTDEIINLGDLFINNKYKEIISENIKYQMHQQMEANDEVDYFTDKKMYDNDFININEEHNFYFDKDGNIVIPFDKYEVAPGYMGTPNFKINKYLIKDILKEEYKNIIN